MPRLFDSVYRYPGLKMKHLVDFREKLEKPSFAGLEGYQEKKPRGPFRLMAKMIRKNVQVIFWSPCYNICPDIILD